MKRSRRGQTITARNLWLTTFEGLFAAGSDNIVTPYIGLFALQLGATASQIGLLSALPALLGNLLQIPYALLTDRIGRRKLICIIGGLGGRGIWLLAAVVPFYLMGPAGIAAFIALVTVRGLLITLGAPAWTALMADIIPRRIRGRYFANRNVYCSLAALGFTLLAGLFVRLWGYPLGYQLIFATGAVLGLTAVAFFARVYDPGEAGPEQSEPDASSAASGAEKADGAIGGGTGSGAAAASTGRAVLVRNPGRIRRLWAENVSFRRYCLSSLGWNLAVTLPAPLFVVYFSRHLGGGGDLWSIVTAASLFSTILSQRYWGLRADRFGNKPVMQYSGFGVALLPLFWMIIPYPWLAVGLNFFAGYFWSGYNLAAFNLILDLTPQRQRTSYVALYNTIAGVAASIGPLIGGFAGEWLGIKVVFAASALLRVLALVMFLRTVEVDAVKMRVSQLLPGRAPGRMRPARGRMQPFSRANTK